MSKEKENGVNEFISDCLKRICPILDYYASEADNDGAMLGKLKAAYRAIGQLISMIPGADTSRYCPAWQVMSDVCGEKDPKKKPKKSK
ncbi:hypothetical protein ACFLRT_05120 [Acidobacteriota bacterium]